MNVICTKDLYMENGEEAYTFGKIYELTSGSLKSGNCMITDNQDSKCHHISKNNDGWIQYFIPEDFKPKNL